MSESHRGSLRSSRSRYPRDQTAIAARSPGVTLVRCLPRPDRQSRSASTCTCRSAPSGAATATSTPTRRPSSAAAARRRRTPGTRSPRWSTPPRSLGPDRPAGLDRVLRRRHPDPAAGRRPGPDPRRDRATPSGWRPGAEVTTEANPDSVTPEGLAALREAGFTRVSFGMQSAVPHVLQVLERTHDPANVAPRSRLGAGGRLRAGEPRPDLRHAGGVGRGLADLGRGGPGLRAGPRLGVLADRRGRHPPRPSGAHRRDPGAGRRRPRGEVRRWPTRRFTAAGLEWYEVSNWARDEAARCRHNELYWTSASWWGVGPGAHSHVAGERWWNVKHPARTPPASPPGSRRRWTARCSTSRPARWSGCCWRSGCATDCPVDLVDRGPGSTPSWPGASAVLEGDRLVLTRRGRLLADAVVRELVG